MSSDAMNVNDSTEVELLEADLFGDFSDESPTNPGSVDTRRKLEDKLEELRLKRDLKEFDFDF